jgi:hypothetical protein
LQALLLPELVPTVIDYLGAPFPNRQSTSVKDLTARGLKPIQWNQLKELPLGAVAWIAPQWKHLSMAPRAQRAVVWFSAVGHQLLDVNFRVVDAGKKKALGVKDEQEDYIGVHGKPAVDGYGFQLNLHFNSCWEPEPMPWRVFVSFDEGEVSKPLSRNDLLRLPAGTHLIVGKEIDNWRGKEHDGFFATFMSAAEVDGVIEATFQTGEATTYWPDVVGEDFGRETIDTPPWFGPDYPTNYKLPPFWQFKIKLSEHSSLVFRRDLSFQDPRPLLARQVDNKSSGKSFTTSGSDTGSSSSSSSSKSSGSRVTPSLEARPDRELRQVVNENTKPGTPILLIPKRADRPIEQVIFAGMGSLANSYWIEVEKNSGIDHLERQEVEDPDSTTKLLLVAASVYGQELPASSLSSMSSSTVAWHQSSGPRMGSTSAPAKSSASEALSTDAGDLTAEMFSTTPFFSSSKTQDNKNSP